MRLIDADKLENDITENITVKAVSRMLAITQGQPTVKAITVEWIENWVVKKYAGAGRIIDCLLEDWEKENGEKTV